LAGQYIGEAVKVRRAEIVSVPKAGEQTAFEKDMGFTFNCFEAMSEVACCAPPLVTGDLGGNVSASFNKEVMTAYS